MSKPGIIIVSSTFYCASMDAGVQHAATVVRRSFYSRVSHRVTEIRSCIQPRLRAIKRMTFHYLEDLHTPTYQEHTRPRDTRVHSCYAITIVLLSLFLSFPLILSAPLALAPSTRRQLDTHAGSSAFPIRRASLPTTRRFNPFTLLSPRIRHAEDRPASFIHSYAILRSYDSAVALEISILQSNTLIQQVRRIFVTSSVNFEFERHTFGRNVTRLICHVSCRRVEFFIVG